MRKLVAALATWGLTAALLGSSHAQDVPEEPVYVHVAVLGDTLIGLSRRLLVDPRRWPELGRFNQIANPNRIPTGTELRIPLRLMRTEAASASVQNVVGDVRTGGAPLQGGQPLGEGNDLVTGADSHATVRLVDGTVLRLRPSSRLVLRESRRVPAANAVQSGARLEQGRVEVQAAPASAGRPGFKIETPQGVLGVRGTEFRVATDGSAGETRGEVLEGVVAFSGRSGAPAPVAAGFGSVIGGGQVAPPVRLLDKPDTAELPTLQERILMRFPLKVMPGAEAYRGQISIDASFDKVVTDLTSPTPELRFAKLPDGDYVLRVRGIGELGLEGQNADLRFKLKARPEAPLPSGPAPKAVIVGGKVEFFWTANADAATYRLQIDTVRPPGSLPPAFKGQALVRDLKDLRELSTTASGLEPSPYVWRMASVRADGDQGPWGDAREFEIRPPPPVPPPPKVGDRGVSFAWDTRPGQTFEFQLARDLAFKDIVLERQLTEPKIDLPLPGTGRFYVRLRARDPDGFIGPYSTPQFFELPNCLRDSSGACVRFGDQPVTLQQ